MNLNNIGAERVRLGMTQANLAEEIGATVSQLSKWEKDAGTCPANMLFQIAKYFNCSADYIAGRTLDRGRSDESQEV